MRTYLHRTTNYKKHPHLHTLKHMTYTHDWRIDLSSKGNQRNVNLQQSTYIHILWIMNEKASADNADNAENAENADKILWISEMIIHYNILHLKYWDIEIKINEIKLPSNLMLG